ncbi:MAG TPA: chemotaxis protein CheW [Stellaceae bacterium]|jgi:purine-binding chemotaxis protein CheW|nr:chemotaxis protein CheW [Stellaceae bacterium]
MSELQSTGKPIIDGPIEALTFALQGEVFAIEAGLVREILDLVPVTQVPGARPFVGGIINVRGSIVPLADLRLRFGMEPTRPTIDTRIIVIDVPLDGEACTVGLLADKVFEVTEIAASSIEETPRVGMRWQPEFIRCIGKRRDDFVIIPDIEQLFS